MAFLWPSVGSWRRHAIIKQEVPAVFHHSMTVIKGITEQNLAMKEFPLISPELNCSLCLFFVCLVRPVTLHAAPLAALPPCGAGSLAVAGPVRAREGERRAVLEEEEEEVQIAPCPPFPLPPPSHPPTHLLLATSVAMPR